MKMKAKKVKADSNASNLRSSVLMYEQQLIHLTFKDVDALERRVKSLVTSQGLEKYALITHDSDVDDGKKVEPHVHVALIFKNRVSVNAIAKALDDNPQQFEVMTKRGNSAKVGAENSLMYLIHRTANSADKWQYPANIVHANFSFEAFVANQEKQVGTKDILDLLGEGKITEIEAKRMMMEKGANVFANYSRKIKDVAGARLEIDYENWLNEIKQSGRSIKIVWCYGESGTGKTRYCLDFAQRHHQTCFKTSGSNDPFEGYSGQNILLCDETRPDSLKFQDLLQILDPKVYEKKTVARYHNAHIMAEIIFVTTPYDPFSFYKAMSGINSSIDAFKQLDRRLGLILRFETKSIFEVTCTATFDPKFFRYKDVRSIDNPFAGSASSTDFSLNDLENFDNEKNDDSPSIE